jgi:dUTP pyrophosphatase
MQLYCNHCKTEQEIVVHRFAYTSRRTVAYCGVCGRYIRHLGFTEVERAERAKLPKVTFYSPYDRFPRHVEGAVGWDLPILTAHPVYIEQGQYTRLNTGIYLAMDPNAGFYARIVSRSSTFTKFGLIVIEGTIDADYRGELQVQVYNPEDKDAWERATVLNGDYIAQIIFAPYIAVHATNKLGVAPTDTLRGDKGWGSTGR